MKLVVTELRRRARSVSIERKVEDGESTELHAAVRVADRRHHEMARILADDDRVHEAARLHDARREVEVLVRVLGLRLDADAFLRDASRDEQVAQRLGLYERV